MTDKEIGQTGEKVAKKWLKKQGFYIIETNFRNKIGEIDIIAEKDNIYHFVEVKSVAGIKDNVFYPEDRVNYKKRTKLKQLANSYLNYKNLKDTDWQIDIASVYLNTKTRRARVEFFENIEI